MTTIIIKSFNRPYYLERCLFSIYKNVKSEFEIKVLDDGTPNKYLEKISKKYNNIKIIKSSIYDQKVLSIKNNLLNKKKIDGFTIPTDLWYSAVKSSSEYVLVIEDDVWFKDEIRLNVLVEQMKKYSMPLLKLGWLGNYSDDKFLVVEELTDKIDSVIPKKIFTANKFIMDLFMYNKYKIFSLLYRLKLVDNNTKNKYWALNSILMGLYRKDYWLAIWKDAEGKVDEKQQLRNAAVWYNNNKKAVFGRTKREFLKTTFKSSATSSYHEYDDNKFDVNRMNYILNEAWFKGQFDPIQNYPLDFSDNYIKTFLDKENHPDVQYQAWYTWSEKFKQQYRNLGAEVE